MTTSSVLQFTPCFQGIEIDVEMCVSLTPFIDFLELTFANSEMKRFEKHHGVVKVLSASEMKCFEKHHGVVKVLSAKIRSFEL